MSGSTSAADPPGYTVARPWQTKQQQPPPPASAPAADNQNAGNAQVHGAGNDRRHVQGNNNNQDDEDDDNNRRPGRYGGPPIPRKDTDTKGPKIVLKNIFGRCISGSSRNSS